MKFADLKIRTKLYVGFGANVVLLAILVVIAYTNFSRFSQATALNTRSYETLVQIHAMLESLTTIQTGARGFALTGQDDFLAPMEAGKKSFNTHMDKAKQLAADNPQQLARLQKLHEEQLKWLKTAIEPVVKLRRGVNGGAIQMDSLVQFEQGGRGERSMNEMRALQEDIRKAETSLLAKRAADAAALEHLTGVILIGGGCVAAVLATVLALLLIRNIVRPLVQAVNVAKTVAAGDLTSVIVVNSRDETGQLLQALKDMNGSLEAIVGQVRTGTDALAEASSEIASGNADISTRTEAQANSLQEIAASIEELTGTVSQNADNAQQANQLVMTTSECAIRGGEVVNSVVATMGTIKDSSRMIADITSVIDGIAFQTNILALNAAVEAARAGEQGRGFAVVAAEVRNLAQRSASAAKEIKELIVASVEKVDTGSKLADEAGKAMHEIVTSVKRVADIMGEITAASREQSLGTEQFGRAVRHVDEMTQQNAALVEEAAAAAASLKEQTVSLTRVVGAFKLREPPAGSAEQSAALSAADQARHVLETIQRDARRSLPAAQRSALRLIRPA